MSDTAAPTATQRSSIASAAALGILATGINGLAALARSKAVAVTLGVAGVGLIAELQQLLTLLSVPAMALTGAALTRRLVDARSARGFIEFREQTRNAASTTFAFTSIAAVLAVLIAPRALSLPVVELVPTVALAGAAAVVTAVMGVYAQALLVHGDIPRAYLASSGNTLLGAILATGGLVALGINGLFLGLLAAAVLAAALAMRMTRISIAEGRWTPSFKLDITFAKTAIRFGGASLLSGLAIQLALSGIRFALLNKGGHELNGLFQAAWALDSLLVTSITSGMAAYFFPRFAAAATAEALQNEVQHAARFAFMLGVPIVVLFAALRHFVLQIAYSSDFLPAAGMLGLLVTGDILKLVGWVAAGPLLYRNKVTAFLSAELAAALLFGSIALVTIPFFGLRGIGFAQIFSYAVYVPLAATLLRRTTEVRITPRILVGAGVLAGLVYGTVWLSEALSFGWVIGVAMAGVLVVLTGGHRAIADLIWRRSR